MLVHNASRSYGVVQRGTINTLPGNVLLEVFNSYRQSSKDPENRPVQRGTINTLPDNVLLEVFNSYRQSSKDPENRPWKWDMLIQVCRKWRNVVLASPLRLDLWLLCTHRTPVRRTLDCWPSLPIVIRYCASIEFRPPSPEDEDNVIAALEHHHRVREIQLAVTSSLLGKIVKLMQVSFPRLRHLSLWLDKVVRCRTFLIPFWVNMPPV